MVSKVSEISSPACAKLDQTPEILVSEVPELLKESPDLPRPRESMAHRPIGEKISPCPSHVRQPPGTVARSISSRPEPFA